MQTQLNVVKELQNQIIELKDTLNNFPGKIDDKEQRDFYSKQLFSMKNLRTNYRKMIDSIEVQKQQLNQQRQKIDSSQVQLESLIYHKNILLGQINNDNRKTNKLIQQSQMENKLQQLNPIQDKQSVLEILEKELTQRKEKLLEKEQKIKSKKNQIEKIQIFQKQQQSLPQKLYDLNKNVEIIASHFEIDKSLCISEQIKYRKLGEQLFTIYQKFAYCISSEQGSINVKQTKEIKFEPYYVEVQLKSFSKRYQLITLNYYYLKEYNTVVIESPEKEINNIIPNFSIENQNISKIINKPQNEQETELNNSFKKYDYLQYFASNQKVAKENIIPTQEYIQSIIQAVENLSMIQDIIEQAKTKNLDFQPRMIQGEEQIPEINKFQFKEIRQIEGKQFLYILQEFQLIPDFILQSNQFDMYKNADIKDAQQEQCNSFYLKLEINYNKTALFKVLIQISNFYPKITPNFIIYDCQDLKTQDQIQVNSNLTNYLTSQESTQSRYSYKNLNELQQMIKKYRYTSDNKMLNVMIQRLLCSIEEQNRILTKQSKDSFRQIQTSKFQ